MKNLFSVAKCFAIKEFSTFIEIHHVINAAAVTNFNKTNIVYEVLSKYANKKEQEQFSTGKDFIKIKDIYNMVDTYPEIEYSEEVKKLIKELEDSSYSTIEQTNIFFISNLNIDEDEIFETFSKKLKSLRESIDLNIDDSEVDYLTLNEEKKKLKKIDRLTQAKDLKILLKEKLFGQEMAINTVYDSIKNTLLEEQKRPLHTFLFLGPPGVGKTYLAELITQSLPEYEKFKIFNMSQFQHDGDGISLYGTSRNYGNGNVGALTSFVKDNPKSIIIFDEFEKAHNNIQNGLLSIFSSGYLVDVNGWCPNGQPYSSKKKSCSESQIVEKVNFSKTIIIITSNLGQELYSDIRFIDMLKSNHDLAEDMIIDVLSRETKQQNDSEVKAITSPMLSRLAQANIALFNKLQLKDILNIAKESFNKYKDLFEQEYKLQVNSKVSELFFKILILQFAPSLDLRRIKAKYANSFFDKISDYIVDENIKIKSIKSIEIDLSDKVINYYNEKIKKLEDSNSLERELIIKNETIKFDYKIIKKKSKLIFTVENIYFEKIKRIKDFQGSSAISIDLPKISFKDIAGHYKAKERLNEIVNLLKNKEKIKKYNIKTPKGVLLYGPPGTGKTMLAKAIAKEAGLPFIMTTANDLINTPNLINDIFKKAKEYAPCIVFIDEIDAFRKRGSSAHNESYFAPKVNQLLTSLDGGNSCEDVFVVAATNRKDTIDEAILRAGRIDIHIHINHLDKEARRYFLEEIILKDSSSNFDIDKLLVYTSGMNGSQLQKLKRESYLYVVRHALDDINQEILLEQINTIKYGEKNTNRSIHKMLEETAYHETGHAIVSKVLMPERKIEQITITPREKTLGFVSYDRDYINYNLSIEDIKNQICISLAGRLSQIKKFGEQEGIDTGASNDLAKATKLAYSAIAHYGMDKEVGNINLSEIDNTLFQSEIEKSLKEWLIESNIKTNNIINEYWKVIESLSQELLENEVIDEKVLNTVMQSKD